MTRVPIRLVLADDHPIVLHGLQQLFGRHGEFAVVATCADGATAVDAVKMHHPDVLVLDLRMAPWNGLDVLRALAKEQQTCRTVLLTAAVADDEVVEAMKLGAVGLVLKESSPETRFGRRVLALTDPHGLDVALVEAPAGRAFAAWEGGPVAADRQIRGLFGAQIWERDLAATTRVLTSTLGFQEIGTEHGWIRYGFPDAPGVLDVRAAPEGRRGAWGVGAVHHLAWRVDDEAHQLEIRGRLEASGREPTPVIDRFWFRSVYFREPGGVLFELATDGPGFAVDEDPAHLGETLVLPPWLEADRATIEQALPPLSFSAAAHARS